MWCGSVVGDCARSSARMASCMARPSWLSRCCPPGDLTSSEIDRRSCGSTRGAAWTNTGLSTWNNALSKSSDVTGALFRLQASLPRAGIFVRRCCPASRIRLRNFSFARTPEPAEQRLVAHTGSATQAVEARSGPRTRPKSSSIARLTLSFERRRPWLQPWGILWRSTARWAAGLLSGGVVGADARHVHDAGAAE